MDQQALSLNKLIEKYEILSLLKDGRWRISSDVPNAWLRELDLLLNKITFYITYINPAFKDLKVQQIKEKWGRLEVYTNYYHDDVEAIIEDSQGVLWNTCEKCGKWSNNGKHLVTTDGWVARVCENLKTCGQ